jgi:hypothetical protein
VPIAAGTTRPFRTGTSDFGWWCTLDASGLVSLPPSPVLLPD